MVVDFVLLCRERRIPYLEEGNHHCHEGWIQVHCPFCGDGSDGWHLGYNIEWGNLHCWRCGKHGMVEWLRQILPIQEKSRIHSIIEKYIIKGRIARGVKPKKIRKRDVKPPAGLVDLQKAHRKYLQDRGFNPDLLIKTWDLKGTTMFSSQGWNWRVVAPIRNIEARVVAYTGRTLSKEIKPRWRTTENELMAEDPRRLIYGIEKVNPDKGVLIVEGPSDVWRMGPGAVGLLGIDWKGEQAGLLRQFHRRFIMFDSEIIAQKRAEELANWFGGLPGETEIITDIPSDPGALSQEDADNIMRELGLK